MLSGLRPQAPQSAISRSISRTGCITASRQSCARSLPLKPESQHPCQEGLSGLQVRQRDCNPPIKASQQSRVTILRGVCSQISDETNDMFHVQERMAVFARRNQVGKCIHPSKDVPTPFTWMRFVAANT
ncbi:hypothetical protein VaNZ11_000411 [Volvox africanus]|uniref:Uncharacterized protein n=1 Tax=Volvox africanus TaxID=51714 RepID=A0ABQ5RM45_9CHLO|nr:hypothetical protein VaNZ11_000408 [Volvox africanus]GLI58668.1 hypothetical protein VaNZ11_000411 [Volvox africanus]